jgi:hypothetical protein
MSDQISINVITDQTVNISVEENDNNFLLAPTDLNQEQFYPLSNPSGFITASQTGAFYPASNPSGFLTGVDLSPYVTGDVVRPSQTGAFYPASNPSGFITGITNIVYTTGDQSIAGNKTFSDNIVANGMFNRLPNQLLSTDAAMNYRLAQIIQNTQSLTLAPMINGWSNVTTLQPNTSIATDRGFIRLDAASNIGFGAITAYMVGGEVACIGQQVAGRDAYVNLSNRVGISFLVKSGGDSFNPLVQDWAFAYGTYDAITGHSMDNLYPISQSTAGYRAYVCVTCNSGEIRLRVCDKNRTRVDSQVLETITGISHFSRNYAIILDAGTAYLYKNRTLLGQVTGATTHNDLNGAAGGAFFNHTASMTGTATRRRLTLVSSKIWWEDI